MFKKLIFVLFITLSLTPALPQQNPPDIKWKYIETGIYTIIFPEEITQKAKDVADLLQHYEKFNYSNLNTKKRKIPIVLINQNTEPNGFVSPAPYYSHFFTTPSSFDGIEWFRGLAVHEGRHMVQMNKLREGTGKTIWRAVFGDIGTGIFSILYIPPWYLEGDAVVMETALTHGGRGRLPYFLLWQRALELNDERYSYYKMYLGSYDAMYPRNDHYRLGYIMTSYIQKKYGPEIWNKILDRTGKYFLFPTFDSSLITITGKSMTTLYNEAMNEYQMMWQMQAAEIQVSDAEIKSQKLENKFESYLFPFTSDDSAIIALLYSNSKKLKIGKIDSKEKFYPLKEISYSPVYGIFKNERTLSAGGNKIIWTESIPHPRWGYKSFSDIYMMDILTGKEEALTDKRRFISSCLSSKGTLAAGIEYSIELKYSLSIFDIEKREEVFTASIDSDAHIFDPAISDKGDLVVFSALSDKGNALLLYDVATKKLINLTGYTFNESFRASVIYDKYIIYTSDYSGIDNIYALDTKTKKRYQITSRKFGAYYPWIDEKRKEILFNDYSMNGYQIASVKLNPSQWTPIEKVKVVKVDTISTISEELTKNISEDFYDVQKNEYEVGDYSPLMHSINFYGWIPYFASSGSEFFISFLSRDVLHTTDIVLSYIRNFNENTNAGDLNITYSKFYPVLTLSGRYGQRAVRVDNQTDNKELDYISWKEKIAKGGFTIPLNFSLGNRTTFLDFGFIGGYIDISDINRFDYNIYNDINTNGSLMYNEYFINISNIFRGAIDSVVPGTGGLFSAKYFHTPYNSTYKGNLFSLSLSIYLPGFTDTQGFILKGSYENIDYKNYIFPSEVLFPRGYESVRYKNFAISSIDYSFPLFNLSTNIWKLTYLKRINGDLFFDYGMGYDKKERDLFRSAGFELTAEQNLLTNLYLQVELGIRYSRCFDKYDDQDENKYEFIFKAPIN